MVIYVPKPQQRRYGVNRYHLPPPYRHRAFPRIRPIMLNQEHSRECENLTEIAPPILEPDWPIADG